MLQTSWLHTFEAVVRLGSFADAGRELDYTTSAVSQQMAALERTTGLQLFERHSRHITCTPTATYLYERSSELIGLLSRVQNELTRLSAGKAGRIRIGSFASAGTALLPRAFERFLRNRDDIEVTLDEGEPHDLVPRVVQGDIDVGLVFRYDLVPRTWPNELRVMELMTEPLVVIASSRHRLVRRKRPASFDQLTDERWIATLEGTALHSCLLARGVASGFRPDIAFRTNNFAAVRGLVSAAVGVAIIPTFAYDPSKDIKALTIGDGLPQRHVAAVSRRLDDGPLVNAFLRSLRDAADSMTGYRKPVPQGAS
ncbi:MAG: LysR family transcriptional regulator [Streptosporangiales bacterium]|nr:LysR family transcriptional regulator [Streptosporangiales bacterium]